MTIKFRVLVTAPYFIPVVEAFAEEFAKHAIEPIVLRVAERASEEDLLRVIENIDGVICGDDHFTRRVLAQAPRLKVLSKWGTGIDSIDRDACKSHGVAVRNTPDAFSHPVADSVLGYILAFARRIPWMDNDMKAGIWSKIPGRSLAESTIGVIGIGNVGRRIVERAAGFGATLLGTDVRQISAEARGSGRLELVDLQTLLGASDYVALACDLNPTSKHLINADTLGLMKSTAVLVNAARGSIVDEKALANALSTGRIAGAGLDVFEDEPLPSDSPLRAMSNVLLAPHNSNSSPRAWEAVHRSTFDNLVAELHRRE